MLHARGVEGQPYPWTVESWAPTAAGLVAAIDDADESPVALLDAAVHLAAVAGVTDSRLYVPAAIDHVQLEGVLAQRRGSVSVRRAEGGADEVIVDVTVAAAGGAYLSMQSLRYVPLEPTAASTGAAAADPTTFAHAIEWRPRQDQEHPVQDGAIAVVGGSTAVEALRKGLADAGHASGDISEARYVLYVADTESRDTDVDCAENLLSQVIHLVRLLADRNDHRPVSLWVLTTGVYEATQPAAVRESCLWGLAGVIAAEHPEIWGGLVDLAPGRDAGDDAAFLAGMLGTPSKSVLLLRDGVFLAPELVPVTGEPARDALRCRPDGAYLITGGLGALGLLMAGWLADRGARRILLAGRTPLPPRRDWDREIDDSVAAQRITAIRELERRGVSVEVVTLDVGSSDDVQTLLARRDREGAPAVRGIIHAAGVVHDQLVTSITDDALRQVIWPKIAGAQVLHRAFPCGSLDFFFLTASAGSVFGIPGQGSYAAANAYLDALARARHRHGCHTVSIDWVAWRGLGFASDAQIVSEALQRIGSRELLPDEAFTAWDHVHRRDVAQAVVIPMASPGKEGSSVPGDQRLLSNGPAWSQMTRAEIQAELTGRIRVVIARELSTAESEVQTDRPFIDLGLNSMMALSIRREIEQLVSLELSATMLWNHPTLDALAAYLAEKLAPQDEVLADVTAGPSDASGSVLDSLFDRIELAPEGSETVI